MRRSTMLRTGVIGAVIAAICCFTPVLAWMLAAAGLAALTGMIDVVLLPALGFFLVLTGYALFMRRREL
ncbi:MAG: mercury resistance system transport protein MerF [Rhodospirillales bacterium]